MSRATLRLVRAEARSRGVTAAELVRAARERLASVVAAQGKDPL